MEYIGNVANWITPEIMTYLQNNNGDTRPVWQPERWQGHPTLDKFRELCRPGYEHTGHDFQQFNPTTPGMIDVTLPDLPKSRKHCHWWFIKLLPGQMQAMHIDPHLVEVANPVRYTVYLQDWIPGHIFTYDDKMIANYKAGDLYEWSDPMTVHGCVNIGYEARYTLQITLHD